jgi:hypothetical protein
LADAIGQAKTSLVIISKYGVIALSFLAELQEKLNNDSLSPANVGKSGLLVKHLGQLK